MGLSELTRTLFVIPTTLLSAATAALVVHGQQPAQPTIRTVWDGAYTDAQAARGEARYLANCSRCHGEGPRRGVTSLPLAGTCLRSSVPQNYVNCHPC